MPRVGVGAPREESAPAARCDEEEPPLVTIEEVVELERQVWSALVAGDAAADASLLTDDFLGVYPSGFAGRSDHAGQLRDGPTVASFDLSDARLLELSTDVALLSYRADYLPQGGGGTLAGPQTMYVTSIWRHGPEGWRNVFSQDTPAPA
jgi:hypothetical protein